MSNKQRVSKTLPVLQPNAAGADIGADEIFVAVPADRDLQPVRRFGTFTPDLLELAAWLNNCGVDTIAMESTSVYWIPLYQIPEERGFRVFLVNAHYLKNVPGRKSDVSDCQWIQYLHSVGLLRASFRPSAEICAIRSLWRHRESLVQMAAQHTMHMQKALDQMNLQLHHVLSSITSLSGLAILDAILQGEKDPVALAKLFHWRVKSSRDTIAKALQAPDGSPAWSPDGRYIAFLRDLGDKLGVFLIPAIGGPERKLTEIDSALEPIRQGYPSMAYATVAWHPDGKWVAFPDQDSIWLFSVETGEKRKLTLPPTGDRDFNPAFSPDGKSLAFSRVLATYVSEIYLLALSDGLAPKAEPKQLTFGHRYSRRPVWTANGHEVIFSFWTWPKVEESELLRLPVAEGGSPRVLLGTPVQGLHPAISHHGDRLAFTRYVADSNIWRIEVAGPNKKALEPVNFISSTYPDAAPVYSPDGKKIVFVSDRSGHDEMWICDSDGSNVVQLTSMGYAGSPHWSPDGQRIVFDSNVGGKFKVYTTDPAGGSPRPLTNGAADDAVASYSNDGRWIYFVSNRTGAWQIWKMPADGGPAVQVTKQGGRIAFESLDGKFVYYSQSLQVTSLWRVPAGGGEETKILEPIWGMAFTVTRKGIYVVVPHPDGSSELQFHSFETSKVTPIMKIHRPVEWGLSVSPDERFILYAQIDQEGSDLMLVENFR